MTETLAVSLGERSYSILFDSELAETIAEQVRNLNAAGRRTAVVTDANVARALGPALRRMFGESPTHVVAPGERSKSLNEFGGILDFLTGVGLDRTGVVFAVGGGVVGDLAGFAAASYLRGVDYYQVPTTLLAMVDSSVGGKTGINLTAGKNLAGAFHQPRGVYVATGLLGSLPPREFGAGMAEVIKYGLLGDAALFQELEAGGLDATAAALPGIVRRCCSIKAAIVQADERETAAEGGRALLNLGHTYAHAIERVAAYGVYLHGEAVAIGLCAAAELSQRLGLIPASDVARVRRAVQANGLPIRLFKPLSVKMLTEATAVDKKTRAGQRRFVVLARIGQAETRGGIDPEAAADCFRAVGAE